MSQDRTPLIERTAPWRAIHNSLLSVGKSNRNAPAYSRWINRPVGRVLAATSYKVGLTPNGVTGVSAVFTFTGIALLATGRPTWLLGIVVALLLMLGYAFDSADGQVARLRGGGSLAGEWLDHVVDSVKMVTVHLAFALLWFRNLGDWPVESTLIPLGFMVVASVMFFAIILTDLLMRNAGLKKVTLASEEDRPSIWTSLLGIPADYGFLCLSLILLGWFDGWRWLYALLFLANVLILIAQSVRWYRRVTAAR